MDCSSNRQTDRQTAGLHKQESSYCEPEARSVRRYGPFTGFTQKGSRRSPFCVITHPPCCARDFATWCVSGMSARQSPLRPFRRRGTSLGQQLLLRPRSNSNCCSVALRAASCGCGGCGGGSSGPAAAAAAAAAGPVDTGERWRLKNRLADATSVPIAAVEVARPRLRSQPSPVAAADSGFGSDISTHRALTRPSTSKATPSASRSRRFSSTFGWPAPHCPEKPPRRRSDATTRHHGQPVIFGLLLRITLPMERAQPPATAAIVPYVDTQPAGICPTTACTRSWKGVRDDAIRPAGSTSCPGQKVGCSNLNLRSCKLKNDFWCDLL